MRGLSIEARFLLAAIIGALPGIVAAALVTTWTESAWLGALSGIVTALPVMLVLMRRTTSSMTRVLLALDDNIASFKDGDFSVSLGTNRTDELGHLVRSFNEIGDVLRAERQNLFQRELLLDTVIQSSPTALVLTDAADHVVYSNTTARRLFINGKRMEGYTFTALLAERRPDFLKAVQQGNDGLLSVLEAGEEEIFHLSNGYFTLNARPHHLYLFKQLTRELTRQEVATWKKVIRVISHELNNSLAPITSLAHSGRELLRRNDRERLDRVFASIEERAAYLKHFIEGYARFAKLPVPQQQTVEWQAFIASIVEMSNFHLKDSLPETPGWFDPVQVQQVMLNLLKNAAESGTPAGDIEVQVRAEALRDRVDVRDHGSGMSETVLGNALLPFYSTKKSGTGLGLSLCREIIEAHGGRLNIANRAGGGLEVSFWLPRRPRS